jgi:hypothetical protein
VPPDFSKILAGHKSPKSTCLRSHSIDEIVPQNMLVHMTLEQLALMHQARPFQPFDIFLADGRTLPVEHPEFLSRSPAGRTIGVGRADGAIEVVDLLLVTSLKPRANGASRRRGKR